VITADDCPGASLRSRYVCQNHFLMATDSLASASAADAESRFCGLV